jgi:flagellar hook protein FlgE
MMRSMYAGVSGLKTHQIRMDVVGNNIANVNTTGYKGSRVTFKEMLNQTLQGAKAAQGGNGGMNPQQIGLGVSIGSIDTNQTQGNLQSTGLSTDLAIQGNGYFIVNNGQQNLYTRAGALSLDEQGNLINASNGYIMQGWMADNSGIINSNQAIQAVEIPIGETMNASPSDIADFGGNLDSQAIIGDIRTATIDIFDSLGEKNTISIEYEKTASNTWDCTVNVTDSSGTNIGTMGSITIGFNSDGTYDDVTYPTTFNLTYNPVNGATDPQDIILDFSKITQSAAEYTIDGVYANGYEMGSLESFSIDDSGVITGGFSNGLTKALGQIAIASFSNSSGLNKKGDTLYAESQNSGIPQAGQAASGGRGKISAGTLEMSNVDLAEQFTDMITTQRGFQSNSKIITTADEMLQDLVNLKR